MKKFLKELFCHHEYNKVDWYATVDNYYNERYAMRKYKCNKCNKEIWIDSRYDPYSK